MRAWRKMGGRLGGLALAALLCAGCGAGGAEGDGRAREPISGTVNFDGQPLKAGTIQFQPASAAEGVAAGGMIADGQFAIRRAEGPVPGKYRVEIYAQPSTGSAGSAEGGAPVPAARKSLAELRGTIPARYNSATELTAEVKPGGPNEYTFDLKK